MFLCRRQAGLRLAHGAAAHPPAAGEAAGGGGGEPHHGPFPRGGRRAILPEGVGARRPHLQRGLHARHHRHHGKRTNKQE
eukprot:681597-Prorocentrum_minimum.AAC.1